MKKTLVLLAVTKMRGAFCIAGVDTHRARSAEGSAQKFAPLWIRPVKAMGGLQSGDLQYPDRTPLAAFDRVELNLTQPRPHPPHTEDWICDFVRERPRRLSPLSEESRSAFLAASAEEDGSPVLARFERSLILLPAADFKATFTLDLATRKLDARLTCPPLGLLSPMPVTDLRWRAFGRALCAANPAPSPIHLSHMERDFGVQRVYLALGLTREFEGRLWPIVIGVHCVPDISAIIDWKTP